MKKVLMLILIMMMLAGVKEVVWAKEVRVSNFSEFNAAISSREEQTIIVADHIKSEGTCNVGAGGKTVIGGGFNLDGNENDAFRLRGGKTLKITGKLTMENFGYLINCAESSVSFDDSEIKISNNVIPSYGTMFFSAKSSLNINNSKMELSNNNMSERGGVLACCLKTTVTINASTLTFLSNQASTGGAIYCEEVSLNIDGSNLTFLNNKTLQYGGALYCSNSSISFSSSNITFSSNTSSIGNGGALYCSNSSISFSSSNIIFSNNVASHGDGGAVACSSGQIIFKDGKAVEFTGNKARNGGALYCSNSSISFSSSNIIFSNNVASHGDGGAMSLLKSTLTINGASLIFSNNTSSMGNGGAVACSSGQIIFKDSKVVEFTGNKAQNGGALCIQCGRIVKLTNVRFRDNIATEKGGGIYIGREGKLTITTNENKISEFVGNKANGQSNGIYMYGAGTITFNGAGRVNMKDAIMATGCNINIEDSCEFYLSGVEISRIGDLKIGDSSTFNLEANTRMAIYGDLTIESNGVFNTGFGMEEAISILGSYIQSGTWTIGIEKREINNYLYVTEDVILGIGSTLNIDMSETGADNELRAYRLINYEKDCIGKFGRVVFSSTSKNPNYELIYGSNSIVLTVKVSTGTEKDSEVSAGREKDSEVSAGREKDSEVSVGTNFAGIKGLNANQKEVARTLDVLSVKEQGEKLAEIGLINNMSEEGKKTVLGELSGYFISNVIKGGGE
ncbi:MAG: hypothetical protein LBQ13_01690, partial [Endomicrobium sp.]|nr:hypothetical protein [Endomicrobium sp.]